MNIVKFYPIDPTNRQFIDEFIINHWYTLDMIVRGERINLGIANGWYAKRNQTVVGLITFRIFDGSLEILSLNSTEEKQGIGTALLHKVIDEAISRHCSSIKVITTNDNTSALRLYQKRGFDLIKIYRNSIDQSRPLKPEIPLLGNDGIPLRHEMELERNV